MRDGRKSFRKAKGTKGTRRTKGNGTKNETGASRTDHKTSFELYR